MFCKEGVLRNFTKFTGKHLCQILFFNKVAGLPVPEYLFNKVAGVSRCYFIKTRLWHRCFPVNFVKILITPFLTEHLWWLFLHFKSRRIKDVNVQLLHQLLFYYMTQICQLFYPEETYW